ncbi:MAG: hypothetical protein NTW29_16155 [Bacteroidetes bacterium]|nr:hypothetical protein [Bacteroidota bacterium]
MTTKTLLYQLDSFFTVHACNTLSDRKSYLFDKLMRIIFCLNQQEAVTPESPYAKEGSHISQSESFPNISEDRRERVQDINTQHVFSTNSATNKFI